MERGKSPDVISVSPGRSSRKKRRHRKQGAKRAILRANGIPTGRSRRRRRIDELESRVVFMESDHEVRMRSLRSDVQLLRLDINMLRGLDLVRDRELKPLERKLSEMEVCTHQPCRGRRNIRPGGI